MDGLLFGPHCLQDDRTQDILRTGLELVPKRRGDVLSRPMHLFARCRFCSFSRWLCRYVHRACSVPDNGFAMFCPHYYCNAWHFQFSAARKCANYDPQRLTIRHHDVSSRHSFGPHPIFRNTCALNVLISPAHLMYKRLQLPTKDPAIPQLTSAKI